MTSRPTTPPVAGPEPVRNRCRCGHFPTTHLKVAAIPGEAGGGFRLVPEGGCQVCGEAACARFAPSI